MSHNINILNGRASMMYHGEVPWHGLGTKVDHLATSEEVVKYANLGYEVGVFPMLAVVGDKTVNVPNKYATIRTDTNQVLGTVGDRYEVVQNREAFLFFDSLVGAGEAIYETAGALGLGERIWLLAKLPGYIKVRGEDIVEKYLLLTNSHNGTSRLRAKLTPVRVVCNNTLTLALSGEEQEVKISHTRSAWSLLETAHEVLGLSNAVYKDVQEIFSRMALKQISGEELVQYVQTLVPTEKDEEASTRKQNIRDAIYQLHESGAGSEMSRGTIWGAYNAVTEYVDHVWTKNTVPTKKLESIWFGNGSNLKRKAFDLALETVNK